MKLKDSRILITGGTGFLGGHLTKVLYQDFGCRKITPAGQSKHPFSFGYAKDGVDLRRPDSVEAFFDTHGPFDVVFHLAGFNGGIGFNQKYPFDIFANNNLMAMNLLRTCAQEKVGKVISIIASCGYPDVSQMDEPWGPQELSKGIMAERDYLGDISAPHPSVACHGYAKRNLLLASQFAREQYGLNAICVCPTTLFGPNDSMDPQRTKVVGALIKKFADAHKEGKETVTCWGDGTPLRELLYVKDAAKLIAQAAEAYDDASPLNLGTGLEYSIRQLAEKIANAVGFQGRTNWDTSMPTGQSRKRLNTARMRTFLPPFFPTPIDKAITETVEWYLQSSAS